MTSYGAYLLETLLTLALVCAVAFAVLYGARRLGVGRPSGAVRLVGQLPLDGRRVIYLVQIGRRVLVVGASEAGFTRLGTVPAADLADLPSATEVPAPLGGSFAAALAKAIGKPETRP
jgi:flagellar biogenesis protein FliO